MAVLKIDHSSRIIRICLQGLIGNFFLFAQYIVCIHSINCCLTFTAKVQLAWGRTYPPWIYSVPWHTIPTLVAQPGKPHLVGILFTLTQLSLVTLMAQQGIPHLVVRWQWLFSIPLMGILDPNTLYPPWWPSQVCLPTWWLFNVPLIGILYPDTVPTLMAQPGRPHLVAL